MANQFLSVERGRRWIQQKVTYVVLESQTEISTARILAILTYKPRCDDETRPNEQMIPSAMWLHLRERHRARMEPLPNSG